MLDDLRKRFPTLVWIVLVILIAAGGLLIARRPASRSVQEAMASHITIKFEDTGDEIKLVRGMFEREMMARGIAGTIDVSAGITNPKTGKPTGFPLDKEYWNQIVEAAKELSKNQPPSGSPVK